jgi:hypothetical protein
MLQAAIGKGESVNPPSDYDGNYTWEIIPSRRPWWMQS